MRCPVCKNDNISADEVCPTCSFSKIGMNFINRSDAEVWMQEVVIPYRKKWVRDIEGSHTIEMSQLVYSPTDYFCKTESGYLIEGKHIEKKQFDNLPIEHCPHFYLKEVCTKVVVKYRRGIQDYFELGFSPDDVKIAYNDFSVSGESYDSAYTFEELCEIIFGKYDLHKVAVKNFVLEDYAIPLNSYYIRFECNRGVAFGCLFPTDFWNLFKDIFSNYFISSEILETELMSYIEYERYFRVTIDSTLKAILTDEE